MFSMTALKTAAVIAVVFMAVSYLDKNVLGGKISTALAA